MDNNQNLDNSQENWREFLNENNSYPSENVSKEMEAIQVPDESAQHYTYQPQQPEQQASQHAQYNQQSQQVAPQTEAVRKPGAYDVENFTVMPVKQKTKVLPIILIIAAAAIIVGGLVFCFFTFFNKNENYKSLEKSYFTKLENSISSISESGSNAQQFTLTITPGKALEAMNIGPTVIKSKSFIDNKGNKSYSAFTLGENEPYFTINAWTDGDYSYLQLPELSDIYLKIKTSSLSGPSSNSADILEGIVSSGINANSAVMPMAESIIEAPALTTPDLSALSRLNELDDEIVNQIIDYAIDSYFYVFSKTADKTKVESTFYAGTISYSCEEFTVSFTTGKVLDFAINVLEKIENDKEIISAFEELNLTKATITSALTYIKETKNTSDADILNKEIAKMIVYVKDGEIIGRKISADGEELKIAHINQDGKFAYELSMYNKDETIMSMVASGECNANKYTGTAKLSAEDDTSIEANFNLEINDYINGSFNFSASSDNNEKIEVSSTITQSSDKAEIKMDIRSGDTNAMSIAIESADITYEQITMPELNENNTIDIESADSSSAAQQKFSTDIEKNMKSFIDKLTSMEKPDLIGYLFSMLSMGMSTTTPDIAFPE